MPLNTPVDELRGTRYVTIIVRLLMDAQGKPVQGELAGVDGNTLVRFVGREGLFQALGDFLDGGIDDAGEAGGNAK